METMEITELDYKESDCREGGKQWGNERGGSREGGRDWEGLLKVIGMAERQKIWSNRAGWIWRAGWPDRQSDISESLCMGHLVSGFLPTKIMSHGGCQAFSPGFVCRCTLSQYDPIYRCVLYVVKPWGCNIL